MFELLKQFWFRVELSDGNGNEFLSTGQKVTTCFKTANSY